MNEEIMNVDLELRTLSENIKSGTIKVDEGKAKLEELRAKKSDLQKKEALKNAEVFTETREAKPHNYIADVQKALRENRAITLNGTGEVNFIRDLHKVLTAKKDILQKFGYFYGANEKEVIPVWGADLGRAVEVDEAGSFETSEGQMTTRTVQVKPFCKSIPVSNEVLNLSSVSDFEAELQKIIADVYADTLAYNVFSADGTGAFKNIYDGATEVTASKLNITALAKLALEVSDKTDNAVIVLNPKVYADIEGSESSAREKQYIKELIGNRTIEGVPVILTSYADDGTNGNYALCGNLSNYAIAMANTLTVEPKKKVGSLVTYFDVNLYTAGIPVVPQNFWTLKIGA